MRFATLVFPLVFAAAGAALASTAARAQAPQTFELDCASSDGNLTTCNTGVVVASVALVRQESSYPCAYGQTWGYDSANVWVTRGCHAVFQVTQQAEPPSFEIGCGSHDYQYGSCDTFSTIQYVDLVEQTSNAGCEEGRSWGYDSRYIWVNLGCGGVFLVHGYRDGLPVTAEITAE